MSYVNVYVDIHIHYHDFLFVSLIIWIFALKLSSFRTLGVAFFSCPSDSIAEHVWLSHLAEVPWHQGGVRCFALAMKPGWQKFFFFLQEADCIWDYEYAMTLISTEAPEQGLTSPHPHFVFLQNWLMNCFIPSVMWSAIVAPQCNESCPFWEDHWLQKLIVRNYFDFVKLCLDGA